ncbi:MAG: hypothetical protein ACM32E_18610 [Gemmatimonadota bacterium]
MAVAPAVDRAAARPWPVLAGWAAVWGAVHGLIWSGRAWFYFTDGAHLLFSPAGLHLYARHSELQIGPLTFLAMAPLVFGLPGRVAGLAAMVLMSGAGLAVLGQLRGLRAVRGVSDRTFLAAGLCFMLVWAELAVTYAHPDDVLAILGTVLALRALDSGRPVAAALLLGLAAGCKPWALAFVPLLLLAGRRSWPRAFAVWTVTAALPWLPFLAADPGTLAAARYRIGVSPASALRLLGVHTAAAPLWDRPVQLALGITLGVLAVRRGRGGAVILAVVAARLLLDPSIKSYYDAGLLTGAVLCDLAVPGRRGPLLALSAVAVFYLPMFALQGAPTLYAALRTAYLIALIWLAVLRRPGPAGGGAVRPGPSEPKGRAAVWTDERRATKERGARREDGGLERPGGEHGPEREREDGGLERPGGEHGPGREREDGGLERPGGEHGPEREREDGGLQRPGGEPRAKTSSGGPAPT